MTLLMLARVYKKPEKEFGFLVHFDDKKRKGYIEEYIEGKWFNNRQLKFRKKVEEFDREEMFMLLQKYLERKESLDALLIDGKILKGFEGLEQAFIRELLKETVARQKAVKNIVDEALGEVLSREIDEKLEQIAEKLQKRGVIKDFSLEKAKDSLKYRELLSVLVERYKKQFPEDYSFKLKSVARLVLDEILKKGIKQEMVIPVKFLVERLKPKMLTLAKGLFLNGVLHLKQENKLNLKISNRDIQEIFEEMYNKSFEHLLGTDEERIVKAFAKINGYKRKVK